MLKCYYSLEVQVENKYIFEIKSKKKLNKTKNMSFHKSLYWVSICIGLDDIYSISVFLMLFSLIWFGW